MVKAMYRKSYQKIDSVFVHDKREATIFMVKAILVYIEGNHSYRCLVSSKLAWGGWLKDTGPYALFTSISIPLSTLCEIELT